MASFVLIIMACEETVDWDLDPEANGRLVVEAILTNEFQTQEIKLSQSFNDLNGETPKLSDAMVAVSANGVSVSFLADTIEMGLYKSESPFAVLGNLEYQLSVDWQGENYTASSNLSSVAPLPEINFRQVGQTDSLTFREFAPLYNPNQQAMYEMDIDWSHLSLEEPTKAKMFFYTFSTVDESELLRPTSETVSFPPGSIVIAKKFGLNDDFAEYLRSLVLETDWKGGFLYSASSNLPTNISNDGLGFFSTCAVLRDTLIAE